MNVIKQYRPSFVSGFENKEVEFSTDEDLVNIPFVKKFIRDNFSHFAVSDKALMAIYDDGLEWWVVGFIKNPSLVKLPKWSSVTDKKRRNKC